MPETASRRHLLLQAPLRLLLQLWSGSCRMPTSTPERPLVHGCVSLIRSRSEIVKLHGLVGRTLWAPFVRPFSCTELEKNKQLNCKLSRSLCTNLVTALLSTEGHGAQSLLVGVTAENHLQTRKSSGKSTLRILCSCFIEARPKSKVG